MRKLTLFLIVLTLFLSGCKSDGYIQVAVYPSADVANKVVSLLGRGGMRSTVDVHKGEYTVLVSVEDEVKARNLLTEYNFYFVTEDLNDLLESKFASLSKLEEVKGNLLDSRVIYNKLSLIPGVLRLSVIVTGSKSKRISVLIISLDELDEHKKSSIDQFLKGLVSSGENYSVSYLVAKIENESQTQG
ncbi:type III secretion protein [Shewanella waksmanii]|uniref:type III secretion protein n=1 Tax=Shewanella waksmanii TaxID=213783 RepID=UPI00373515CC